MDEIINKKFLQNCGDNLIVLEKTNKKKDSKFLYHCKFEKYPYEIFVLKGQILKGTVNNPQIEQVEFVQKLWPQNCGDTLKIIRKTENKLNNAYLWECEFIKYPYKLEVPKRSVQLGYVNNPMILKSEFVGKKFLQNCQSELLVLKEIKQEKENNKYITLFEVEFQNPYYKTIASKSNILNGEVYNYGLDNLLIGQIYKQNCGDSLKVLEKTNQKRGQYDILWKAEFLKYPCIIFASINNIKKGRVENPNLPWKSKELLENFIKLNFKNKITLADLSFKLNISRQLVGQCIIKYELRDYLKYNKNKIENEVKNILENILNKKSKKIRDNKYEIDIYFKELNLGIEYNGTYWHSELFKESNYHQKKSIYFREKNIRLIHIWEWEWEEKRNILLSFFKEKQRIGARKCIVKEIQTKKYQQFCEENHLQGSKGAKIKLGLFYKDELVQVMSFGKPRFTDKYEWEIIRECSKSNYIILGGKEKLWKYFIKNYSPNSVISYCDFSKFTGESYLKLGFKFERLNKPGFVWYDEKTHLTYWRNPYQNKEMKEKGYLKIYDAGQLVFIWNK